MTEKPENQPTPIQETGNPTPKPEAKKGAGSLFSVTETANGFEVVLPGLYDAKRDAIIGTRRENFATNELAEQAIERARNASRVLFEKASLEKTYGKSIFRIDETVEGEFRVTIPGLIDSKQGRYIGTTSKDFKSWDEAKDYLLQIRESEEQIAHNPLLEIKPSENEKIAFSSIDAFNPRVAPSEQTLEIPPSVEKYLMGKGRLDGSEPSASTYQETIKEEGWERNLFSFVSKYLEKEGTDITKELGIEHLDVLTPKQAVELATRIVIDLTKYKWSDVKDEVSDIATKPEKTKADQSTVQQLLEEGLEKKDDPEWEGNGICRNFASAVKAIFEALKANQTAFSQLHNTYALYEAGMEGFAPRRQKKNVTELNNAGHAWNTFVTISREGAANAVIVDATWAKRNLDTKEVEGLDYTLTRMEPVVYAVGQSLEREAPHKAEQVQHLLSYYALKIEGSNQTSAELPPVDSLDDNEKLYFKQTAIKAYGERYDLSNTSEDQLVILGQRLVAQIRKNQESERERQFFVTRAVELMMRQGVPNEIPHSLVEAISSEYEKLAEEADIREIETIYTISKNNPDLNFRKILKGYLKDKQLSNYHASALIIKDNELQRIVFEEIKLHKDFEKFMKDSPKFRARMREVIPELFVGFSPEIKTEDMQELRYLIGNSRLLARYERMIYPEKPSPEKIKSMFEKVRQSLRDIDPSRYEELVAGLDDYQLIKQYDSLDKRLRSPRS